MNSFKIFKKVIFTMLRSAIHSVCPADAGRISRVTEGWLPKPDDPDDEKAYRSREMRNVGSQRYSEGCTSSRHPAFLVLLDEVALLVLKYGSEQFRKQEFRFVLLHPEHSAIIPVIGYSFFLTGRCNVHHQSSVTGKACTDLSECVKRLNILRRKTIRIMDEQRFFFLLIKKNNHLVK